MAAKCCTDQSGHVESLVLAQLVLNGGYIGGLHPRTLAQSTDAFHFRLQVMLYLPAKRVKKGDPLIANHKAAPAVSTTTTLTPSSTTTTAATKTPPLQSTTTATITAMMTTMTATTTTDDNNDNNNGDDRSNGTAIMSGFHRNDCAQLSPSPGAAPVVCARLRKEFGNQRARRAQKPRPKAGDVKNHRKQTVNKKKNVIIPLCRLSLGHGSAE